MFQIKYKMTMRKIKTKSLTNKKTHTHNIQTEENRIAFIFISFSSFYLFISSCPCQKKNVMQA